MDETAEDDSGEEDEEEEEESEEEDYASKKNGKAKVLYVTCGDFPNSAI